MTAARDDKRTLGVTADGAEALEKIMSTGWFPEEMDAYRVAISLAFANDLMKNPSEMTGVATKWNIGTLDPDDVLLSMAVAFSDEHVDRPYAHAEARAAAGLVYLKRRLVDERAELADVLMKRADL